MRRITFIIIMSACTYLQGYGQQLPNWSSFYENGFIWNPALTAQWYSWEASATHRKEWSGFQFAPQLSTIGVQVPLSDAFFRSQASMGGFLQSDQIGPYTILGVAGTYAYKITPELFGNKKDMLSIGVMAQANQFRVDADRVILFDNVGVDPISSSFQPNLSLGFFYRSNGYLFNRKNHFFFGAAAHRLLPFRFGDISIGGFTNDFYATVHGGFRAFTSKQFYIEPNVMAVYGYQDALDVMVSIRGEAFEKLWFGTGMSTTGEVFGQVGVGLDGRSFIGGLVGDGLLKIGIKTDYRLGSLSNHTGIGYEFYVGYQYEIE